MTLQQIRYAVTLAECSSMNKAAAKLYISQPSLSASMKELEEEIGVEIFIRTNRGIQVTPEGNEFLGYARQMLEHYKLLDERYIKKKTNKMKFGVSMQHYSFAVKAFVSLVKQFGMEEYEFSIQETKTKEVIEDVKNFRSEIGVLYLSQFNEEILHKILKEYNLEFEPLFECSTFAYLWREHPLAKKKKLTIEELDAYPYLTFDQGEDNSFFLSEEILSTYHYKRSIQANDRATMLNLMIGLNGFTLCSGIICEELNGNDYKTIPVDVSEKMCIGYVKRKNSILTRLGELYIEELRKYRGISSRDMNSDMV